MLRTSFSRLGLALLCMVALLVGVVPVSPVAAASRKLSEVSNASGDVFRFQLSSDNRFAVYTADQETDGLIELYSVPLSGGSLVKLSPSLATGDAVLFFTISPNSSRVVFTVFRVGNGQIELYSIPIGGGQRTLLNEPDPNSNQLPLPDPYGTGGKFLLPFEITSDSSRVVYHRPGFYSIPIAGGERKSLFNDIVDEQKLTPDGKTVVFTSSFGPADKLYSAPTDGSSAATLLYESPFPVGATVLIDDFIISKDSKWVVFGTSYSALRSLISRSLVGSETHTLSNTVSANFTITSDSTSVIYPSDSGTGITKSPVTGGTPVPITSGTADWNIGKFQLTADEKQIVYLAQRQVEGQSVYGLFSAPVAGGTATQLTTLPLCSGLIAVGLFQLSRNSTSTIYCTQSTTPPAQSLHFSLFDGSAAKELVSILQPNQGDLVLNEFSFTPDSKTIFYSAGSIAGTRRLSSVPTAGGTPSSYEALLNAGQAEFSVQYTADDRQMIYRAAGSPASKTELYVMDVPGMPASNTRTIFLPLVRR